MLGSKAKRFVAGGDDQAEVGQRREVVLHRTKKFELVNRIEITPQVASVVEIALKLRNGIFGCFVGDPVITELTH